MATNKKLTTELFVEKATALHGSTYSYSTTVYSNAHTKVKIICPKHGEFLQSPADHANRGRGCPECGRLKRASSRLMGSDEFMKKSEVVHNFKYAYDNVVYLGSQKKVKIICPKHGEFLQLPTNHLSGKGCPTCANLSASSILRLTNNQFIEKACKVHSGKYDYRYSNYVNNHTKVKIICPKHGDFLQSPMAHVVGSGCPSCSSGGFKPGSKSFIYVLVDEAKSVMKIGITNDLKIRLYSLKSYTPFKFEIHRHLDVPGKDARRIEKAAHKLGKSCNFKNFQGCTEWFEYSDSVIEFVEAQTLKASDAIELAGRVNEHLGGLANG